MLVLCSCTSSPCTPSRGGGTCDTFDYSCNTCTGIIFNFHKSMCAPTFCVRGSCYFHSELTKYWPVIKQFRYCAILAFITIVVILCYTEIDIRLGRMMS